MKKFSHSAGELDIIVEAVFRLYNQADVEAADLFPRLVNFSNEKHYRYKLLFTEKERYTILNAVINLRNDILLGDGSIELKAVNLTV